MAEATGLWLADAEENGVAEFDSVTLDGTCTLEALAVAAIHGNYGFRVTFDGTNDRAYGTRNHGSALADAYARCTFNLPSAFSANTSRGDIIALCSSSGLGLVYPQFSIAAGVATISRFYYYDDTVLTYLPVSGLTITRDADHLVEIKYKPATAAGANDGRIEFWWNETLVASKYDVDNDTRAPQVVRAGNYASMIPTSGSYYDIDDIKLDSAYIGPYEDVAVEYDMTYHANGATSGSVPIDSSSPYTAGATVTVLGNTGSLAIGSRAFASWNTAADGSGTTYVETDTFVMPASGVVLYAIYEAEVLPDLRPTREQALARITGTTYHVSTTGSDSADGSASTPWKTIAHAMGVAVGGDGILLAAGTYNEAISDTVVRTAYLVVMNEADATPLVTQINVNGGAYLYVYGIKITPAYVSPGAADPQQPDSSQTTYTHSLDCVNIASADHISVVNCVTQGYNKYLVPRGFEVEDSSNIEIGWCEVLTLEQGIAWSSVDGFHAHHNHVHQITRSAFANLYGSALCTAVVIEFNHGHDSNYDFADDYCPRGANYYHGSAVAIETPNHTVRGNIFHDGFNSAGIMTYTDWTGEFFNIIIEDNLLYDIRNYYVLRLYQIGANCVVRNNTLVGHISGSALSTVFQLNSVWTGYDGSNLEIYNNVVCGLLALGEWADNVTQKNNIAYAVTNATDRITEAVFGGGTKIICQTSANNLTYFDTGFFAGTGLDWTWDITDPYNGLGHGNDYNVLFKLGAESDGLLFGDEATTSTTSLGAIYDGTVIGATTITTDVGAWHGTVEVATYSLTYHANGADSGSVPVDSTEYESGDLATVAGNTGSLVRSGYTFGGWRTAAGSGTVYAPGSKITMNSDTVLYAYWRIEGPSRSLGIWDGITRKSLIHIM